MNAAAALRGRGVQARYLIPRDLILVGPHDAAGAATGPQEAAEVVRVRAFAVSLDLPPTVVVDYAAAEGTGTGCAVYVHPECTVMLLGDPAPHGVAA